jgi:hypothetical protein
MNEKTLEYIENKRCLLTPLFYGRRTSAFVNTIATTLLPKHYEQQQQFITIINNYSVQQQRASSSGSIKIVLD